MNNETNAMGNDLSRSIKVMMVGPGSGIPGSVSDLVTMIMPHINSRVQLYYFPTVSNRPMEKSGKLSIRNILFSFEQFYRMARSIRKFQPQILHIHTSQGIAWLKDTIYVWIGKMMKSKIIIHFQAVDFSDVYPKNKLLFRTYSRLVLNKSNVVIAISDNWKLKLSAILPEHKTFSLMNCIQLTSESTSQTTPAKRISYGLFPGSISRLKGAFDLMDAVKLVKSNGHDIHLWIAGKEEKMGDLNVANQKLESQLLKNRCELVGEISGQKQKEYLRNMDFLVLPCYKEELPTVILEGMAEGRAIISTPVGSIPSIVVDGFNGFLVEPGDIKTLADRISTLAYYPDLCKQMGRNSLEIVRTNMGVQNYVDRIVGIYEGLVSEFT